MERVTGELRKGRVEVEVETSSGLGLGVDEEGAHTNLRRHRRNLEDGVSNKRATESPTLLSQVHAESGEDDDRYWIAPRPGCHSFWGVLGLD